MKEPEREMTLDEMDRWLEDRFKQRIPRVKPKLIAVQASRQMVEAIKENPQSLRMSAHNREVGVTVVDRPYASAMQVRIDLVREVDAHGRPVWDRPGVVHEYDICAALRRD